MNATLARALFHAWPFRFGHLYVRDFLGVTKLRHPEPLVTTRLRRYGLQFTYDPNSYIGQFVFYRGIFEEAIIRAIESCLIEGGSFIDVGANIGLHSVVAAQLVGPRGKVFAFEPQTRCREQLMRNAAQNGLGNITISPHAVGREPGTARIFAINSHNDGQATLRPHHENCPSEAVDLVTLDSLKLPADCVLKIDVEGGEMDVLAGGVQTIREQRARHIFIEVIDEYLERFGSSRRELLTFLADAGYELRGLIRGRWVSITADVGEDVDVWASVRSTRH